MPRVGFEEGDEQAVESCLYLKMEIVNSSEMSVDFSQTAWLHLQRHNTFQSHRCENHKSHIIKKDFA
jgi:hypothetical protein